MFVQSKLNAKIYFKFERVIMSIRNRILILSGLLFSLLLIAMVVGLTQISKFNTNLHSLYDDRIVPLKDLKQIADAYAINIVDTNHKLRNGNISWQTAENNIRNAKQQIEKTWQAYMATQLTPEEAKLAQTAENLMLQANQAAVELLQIVQSQNMAAVENFSIHQLYPVIDPISDAIAKLINLQLEVAQQINTQTEQAYQTLMKIAIIGALVIFGFVIWFVWSTLRAITLPLNQLVDVSTQVKQTGDLSKRVKITRMDEVGQAASAFNQLMENTALAIQDANKVVGAIAQSDFSQRITNSYQGDLNELKQGVNASAESVAFMMDELSNVMQALHNGQFNAKMDERVPQAFRDQVETALRAIDQVLSQINEVMAAMNAGQFKARITTDAQGDLGRLKNNINGSMDALEAAIAEIRSVIVAQSEGDLTQKITHVYQGELDQLKAAINHSVAKLTAVVSDALNAANIVHTASDEVSRGALDLSQRVQQQAASLEETSATMDQMNSAVQNNTQNAQAATTEALDAQQHAQQGQHIMAQTIEAMNQIQASSHKISEIVSLIDGIAFQTNLLALNAAVEAARAGEHGRGFAVVAGEVRALAQKSAEAAKEISSLISESVTRIDQGTKLASESGETLNTMTGSIEKVTQMIEQIAQASSEQAEGVNQVHQAINQIDQVTQQNAALVEQTSAAAESLSEQAENLNQDMSFFNTGQSAQLKPKTAKVQTSRSSTAVQTVKPLSSSKNAVQKPTNKSVANTTQPNKPTSTAKHNDEQWDEF